MDKTKNRTRVAFYMTTVLEHWGGLERYLCDTASYLKKNSNVDTNVITMDDVYTQRIINMLSLFYLKKIDIKHSFKRSKDEIEKYLTPSKYIKANNIKLLREELNNYDVIYSKNELIEAFIFKILIRYKNAPPIIFGCHTPIKYSSPDNLHQKLHNFLYSGFIYKYLASGVDTFHVINQYDFEQCKILFPNKKVIKIYNPFDNLEFQKLAKNPPIRYKFDTNKFNILWVGRFTTQKGIDRLVKIIETINKDKNMAKKIQWNIIGSGEEKEELYNLENKSENIKLFGFVQPENIPNIYMSNQLFLSTSRWEGYPYNLLEATSARLSIIASDIPGNQDILSLYNHGTLVSSINGFVKEIEKYVENSNIHQPLTGKIRLPGSDQKVVYDQLEEMFLSV